VGGDAAERSDEVPPGDDEIDHGAALRPPRSGGLGTLPQDAAPDLGQRGALGPHRRDVVAGELAHLAGEAGRAVGDQDLRTSSWARAGSARSTSSARPPRWRSARATTGGG